MNVSDLSPEPLTPREKDILSLLGQNLSDREIAERLVLSLNSVKWYNRQVYGKLGVANRQEAVSRARELALLAAAEAPTKKPANNLPRQLSSFIGREKEIDQVVELIREYALVTLTGEGGVGKTRLAQAVAEELLDDFTNGVWYVELDSLSDPQLLAHTLASRIGVREAPDRSMLDSLISYFQGRQALLVLDNCEHLVAACADLVHALLSALPRLKVLATSREPLGMSGEILFRVPSLAYPADLPTQQVEEFLAFESVCLFVDRARAALSGFQLTPENASGVAQICRRLDGIPLAIVLAAARLSMLTTEQLVTRLDRAFLLLTGGSRTVMPHHQTLRATMDWSYQLLFTQEQILLRRLAVFAGGGTLEAIEAICTGEGLEAEHILDLLSGLVSKSMVSVERKQQEETRFRLLETVRQYTYEKLDEAKERWAFHDRHLDYFLTLAEAIEPLLRTSIALERLQELHQEVDNVRTALSWALDDPGKQKIEAGLRLASALLNFWHTQSFQNEGYTWLKKGLSPSLPALVDPRVRAKACFSAGHLILPLGRTAEARQWMQESLDIYRGMEDPGGVVMAQSMLGEVAVWSGSWEEARELGEASLAVCRGLHESWLLAWVLCRCGMIFYYRHEVALSQSLLEESLAIFEHLGDLLQVGDHFISLGYLAYERGDLSAASANYQKALSNAQARQSQWTEAIVLRHLGRIAYEKGEYQQMQSFLQKSVFMQRENVKFPNYGTTLSYLGSAEINLVQPGQAVPHFKESLQISTNPEDLVASLIGMARAALQTNQAWIAAQLLGACQRYIQVEGIKIGKIGQKEYERSWTETKAQLDEPAFELAISEGQALTLDEAVKYAISISLANPGG